MLPESLGLSLMRPMTQLSPRVRRRSPWLSLAIVSVSWLAFVACVPPTESGAPIQEPEPVDDGGIPWAPGEAPENPDDTTREVESGPEPVKAPPPGRYEEDGVHEASAARCTGKATPALRSLVDVRAQETAACSAKIPQSEAGASGDMKISLKIGTTGEVKAVEVLSDTLKLPEVLACVEETLKKSFTEAKPRGGCALFVLPLHFESEKVVEETDDSFEDE